MQKKDNEYINLKDKTVIVLGGGDTAMDCNRTALRRGAKKSTVLIEEMNLICLGLKEKLKILRRKA